MADGRVDVALVVGGEDKHRQLRAAIEGIELDPTREGRAGGAPDERWAPAGEILSRMEIERDLAVPAQQYALIESALAHAEGRPPAANADRLGALWARFAAVAATRPEAWDRSAPDASHIAQPSDANRMLSTPYTKLLCSQWNVDQAAALVVVSVSEAERRGIPRDRWIFPLAAAESNLMVPLSVRADLHRSPAVAEVGRAVLAAVDRGAALAAFDVVDLYSCFPAAVGVQARELGLDEGGALTVTGGMTFGGGPLNNYGLQALAVLAERLRAAPGAVGLVTSISGMLTKFGGSVWSTRPADGGFVDVDVTEAVADATGVRRGDPEAQGPARVVAATVIHDRGQPSRAVAVLDTADGSRTVARCHQADVVTAMVCEDWIGRGVVVTEPGAFVPA